MNRVVLHTHRLRRGRRPLLRRGHELRGGELRASARWGHGGGRERASRAKARRSATGRGLRQRDATRGESSGSRVTHQPGAHSRRRGLRRALRLPEDKTSRGQGRKGRRQGKDGTQDGTRCRPRWRTSSETSLAKIKEMVDANTVVGDPVTTPDGVTLVPVSRGERRLRGRRRGRREAARGLRRRLRRGRYASSPSASSICQGRLRKRMLNIQPPAVTTLDPRHRPRPARCWTARRQLYRQALRARRDGGGSRPPAPEGRRRNATKSSVHCAHFDAGGGALLKRTVSLLALRPAGAAALSARSRTAGPPRPPRRRSSAGAAILIHADSGETLFER